MVVEGINLMGRQVRYLDHLSMPQIGTIIDWKPHNTKPEVMILAVINVREKLNEEPYTYMDKIEAELKILFTKKDKEIKEREARQKQLLAGDKQDESDDQSED